MIEKLNRPLPDYYRSMYKDYEPWEVLAAAHKKMLAAAAERQTEPQDDYTVNITSEVKVKQ